MLQYRLSTLFLIFFVVAATMAVFGAWGIWFSVVLLLVDLCLNRAKKLVNGIVLASFLILVGIVCPGLFGMMIGGPLDQFRITNATGERVMVTSAHTQKSLSIANQETASISHSSGDITVTMPDGKTRIYRNLSLSDLWGTPFLVKKQYSLFRVRDGYVISGLFTVNLLLDKNGLLYAVSPDANDMDVGKLKQPKGFPVKPDAGVTSLEHALPNTHIVHSRNIYSQIDPNAPDMVDVYVGNLAPKIWLMILAVIVWLFSIVLLFHRAVKSRKKPETPS